MIDEGKQLHEKIVQLKLKSNKDGKKYTTDTLDTKGILRLIESVSSPKAEPFKMWLVTILAYYITKKKNKDEISNYVLDIYGIISK